MRDKRINAAQKVAKHLLVVEGTLDRATSESGEFISTMLSARDDAGLAAAYGQSALDEVGKGVKLLIKARRCFVTAHGHLDTVKTDIGLRAVSFGDLPKKPPFKSELAEPAASAEASQAG